MSGEEFTPDFSDERIADHEASFTRFEEAVRLGHLLPADGKTFRSVSESFRPEVVAYVMGEVETLPVE